MEAAAEGATPEKKTEEKQEKPENIITFDDFIKVELTAGQIVVAEDLEGSEKLLRLEVDIGEESGPRQILAGIKKHFDPESLVGRKIVVVSNLKPRKMMGTESNGMLLAAHTADGGLNLVDPGATTTPGTRIG